MIQAQLDDAQKENFAAREKLWAANRDVSLQKARAEELEAEVHLYLSMCV